MSNFKSFKLFKLPSLAYENVIRQMGLVEIFNLSLCSKRTLQILKYAIQPHPLSVIKDKSTLSVMAEKIGGVISILSSGQSLSDQENGLLSGKRYSYNFMTDKMKLVFIDHLPIDGFKEVVDHLKDLFRSSVKNVELCGSSEILEYLDAPQGSIQRLSLFGTIFIDEVWRILCRLPNLKYLDFADFCNGEEDVREWVLEEMKVRVGFSITVPRLLNMKCAYLTIEHSMLISAADFNGYLKKWANGEVPWLKHLTIWLTQRQETIWLSGIQHQENVKQVLNIGSHNRTAYRGQLMNAFDVQSNSGVQATLFVSEIASYVSDLIVDFVVRQ